MLLKLTLTFFKALVAFRDDIRICEAGILQNYIQKSHIFRCTNLMVKKPPTLLTGEILTFNFSSVWDMGKEVAG